MSALLKSQRKNPRRKFRVLYSVTRSEYYEIEAANPDEALDKAFGDGECVEVGDTTDVTDCAVEEIENGGAQ